MSRPTAHRSNALENRGLNKIAVVMVNYTGDPSVNELEFAQIFSTELERIAGAEVASAAAAEALVCHNELLMPQDLEVLGRLMNVDAIMLGFVRRYEVSRGPSVGLAVELHQIRRGSKPTGGHPARGPEPMVVVERVYDGGPRPTKGDPEMTEYLRYVSDHMVREILDALK